MGRAMLIICAGVLISLGFVSLGTQSQGKQIMSNNVGYAEFTQAKNRAHTAIQMAFQEMNKDIDWAKNHDASNKWTPTVDGQTVELYVDYFHDNPAFFGVDSLRIFASTLYGEDNSKTANIESVYTRNEIDMVPKFEGALTLASKYTKVTTNGSATISGNNTSCSENKPGIVANNADAYTDATSGTLQLQSKDAIQGDPNIGLNTDIKYDPTDELIARLAELSDVTKITGSYKGDLGTQENPGVFFVEDQASLTGGISEGYGIMVIRTNGALSIDSAGTELDVAGNLNFNGLVIFENAYNLDGKGTPTINGSVLVGNTEDYNGKDLDIDLSGNINIQYDCKGEDYANQAAAMAFKQGRYNRIVTFE
ncbi:hypothetical protein G3570_09915 [Balneolaceae bacterium YR4-1]|uniref:Type 4 fimbrial biogenesis protein PilX N-terminal domain-containing protein n=1 Tax=Halalkalibaculum roseum TaxID=2709311 RepID=A0A6M1SPD4_9BACT|nr:hypothetical protein [Halalkalibaculum roseum]NGP76949.1 hypothetical protein [Halalkalibaculum roseum]